MPLVALALVVVDDALPDGLDSGALEAMVNEVIAANAGQVEQYLAAEPDRRKKLVGFFVGQVMKLSKGQANPQMVNQLLAKKLV